MVEQSDERNLALSITWLKVIFKYSYLIIVLEKIIYIEFLFLTYTNTVFLTTETESINKKTKTY